MLMRLSFFLIFTLIYSQAVFGCSCSSPPPPATALKYSTAVFTGKVIAISPAAGYSKNILFKVEKAWKGVRGPLISVSTSADGASCGNSYSVGESWLVYARGTGNLSTSVCSRTSQLKNAQRDLQVLGVGSSPSLAGLWVAFIFCAGIIVGLSVLWFKKHSR